MEIRLVIKSDNNGGAELEFKDTIINKLCGILGEIKDWSCERKYSLHIEISE